MATEGTWKIEKDGPDLTAAGLTPDGEPPAAPSDETGGETASEGRGRLVGVVMDPATYALGEPFDLTGDAFTAPADGHLYLRCADGWGRLADNSGKVEVKLSLAD